MLSGILIGSLLWAQIFPNVNNRVAEIEVTDLFQMGNQLKVTVQNVSGKTIRGITLELGKHTVSPDWSKLAGGGLGPKASASVTISMAGLRAGGTPHHPAPPGTLEVVSAVFVGGSPATPVVAEVFKVAEPAKPSAAEVAPPKAVPPASQPTAAAPTPAKMADPVIAERPAPAAPVVPTSVQEPKNVAAPTAQAPARAAEPVIVERPAPAAPVVPTPVQEPKNAAAPTAQAPARAAEPVIVERPAPAAPVVPTPVQEPKNVAAPTAQAPARAADPVIAERPAPAAPVVPTPVQEPKNVAAPTAQAPARAADPIIVDRPAPAAPEVKATPIQEEKKAPSPIEPRPVSAGTHEQGSKDEFAKLISLVEVYEPELAESFPRQALREMVAAVVKEQNELAAKPDVTEFDHGQRSAVLAFAYGIQLIYNRRDVDDDAIREQVTHFLKKQREALAKR